MMEPNKIFLAVVITKRFLNAAEAARERLDKDPSMKYGCKETAALRRASLDLTRALAQMRKP